MTDSPKIIIIIITLGLSSRGYYAITKWKVPPYDPDLAPPGQPADDRQNRGGATDARWLETV